MTARTALSGRPLEEHVGEYQFELSAMDAEGLTTSEQLSVAVRLYQQWRAINHRFYLTFRLERPTDFNRTVSSVQLEPGQSY